MPQKEEILQLLSDSSKSSYSKNEVVDLIHSVSTSRISTVTAVRPGDIYVTSASSKKKRPAVVVSVNESDGYVVSIPFTTTTDHPFVLENILHNSRFLEPGYFTKTLIYDSLEVPLQNVCGIYENPIRLKQVVEIVLKQLFEDTKGAIGL